ncbi:MAG: hydroxymethylglutaryl-CoA lyase [Desulfobacteraceae bacterium]|nr:hydroxymethylglutaryl-CoA lyase [Desulfobacteraceae bacterium]
MKASVEKQTQLPKHVHLTEVGLREGLQIEKQILPTKSKVDLIMALAGARLPAIQVAAFVHPAKMPQMADAEAVIARLPGDGNAQYSALTLNLHGVERACRTSIPWIEVSLSVDEPHSLRNSGMTVAEARQEMIAMVALAKRNGRKVRATIQCAFGYAGPQDISVEKVREMAVFLLDQGVDLLLPADTTGTATPQTIDQVLNALLPLMGQTPMGLHLHDTRGLGLVNVMTALRLGISHFDSSLGGVGGCPFVSGAAGNIATEDTLHLLQSMGIETGIDGAQVAACSQRLSAILGHPLPGKIYQLVPLI